MKDVVGYPGYVIYEDGRIYSMKRNIFMKIQKHYKGYEIVGLWHPDKKRKVVKVHRLLAQAYIPNPENKPQVDHINRIKDDNRKENLRWVNRFQNSHNIDVRIDNELGLKNIQKTKKGFYCIRIIRYKKRYCKNMKTKEEAIKQRDLMLSMW